MISPAPNRPCPGRSSALSVRLPLALVLALPTAALWALEPPPVLPALAGPPVSASSASVQAAPTPPDTLTEASPVLASPAAVPAAPVWMPPTDGVGPVRVTYWGIHAYDAKLLTRPDFDINQYEHHDLILQLSFARDFLSTDLARRASSKMADNARWGRDAREQWRQALAGMIPDIKRGDLLTIEHRADQGVQLRLNNRLLGSINDPVFARSYLGLWLSPAAADVALRRAVLHNRSRTP